MKHKGYNNVTSSNGNSTAQKFGYNGVELNESLGLNLMEMDFRLYDPTIGRFNGIDPVIHHSHGTSVAFDNNPVYWADPSGADAVTSAGGGIVWGFSDSKQFDKDVHDYKKKDDKIINKDKKELEIIAKDLNTIFKTRFGETPFKVIEETRGEDEDKYTVYVLKGSIGFDWEQHAYTRMLRDILISSEDITVDIMDGDRGQKLLNVNGGGQTMNPNRVEISNLLIQKRPIKRIEWSFGGVTLHELLRHIHREGDRDSKSANPMREYFKIKTGGNYYHPREDRFNKKIVPTGYPDISTKAYREFIKKMKRN